MALSPEQRTILGLDEQSTLGIDESWMEELVNSFEERRPSALELAAQAERSRNPVEPDPAEARNAAISATLQGDEDDAQNDEAAAVGDEGEQTLPPPSGAPVADVPAPEPAGEGGEASVRGDSPPPGPVADPRTKQALDILTWAESLHPDTVAAFDAVESGRGVVIPREDAEAFMAWKNGATKPAPAAPSATRPVLPALDEYADDATKALYAQVEALTSTVEQQRQDHLAAETARLRSQQDAEIAQRASVFSDSFTQFGESSGLSPEDLVTVMQYASSSNLIRIADQELSQFDRNGRLISPADPSRVAQAVVERAIYAIPELRQRSIDAEVQRRLNEEQTAIIATNQKKNRAASITSAPIAANTDNRDVRSMTPDERHAAITAAIRQATSG